MTDIVYNVDTSIKHLNRLISYLFTHLIILLIIWSQIKDQLHVNLIKYKCTNYLVI